MLSNNVSNSGTEMRATGAHGAQTCQSQSSTPKISSRLFWVALGCHVKVKVSVTQLCPALHDPTDYGSPGSSVHGILQARIPSRLPFPSPGHLPNPVIKSGSPTWQAGSVLSEPLGQHYHIYNDRVLPIKPHFKRWHQTSSSNVTSSFWN